MSFLGKILVVVQVVLTILFMAFAGAVSATHQNWRVEKDKIAKQLSDKDLELRNEQARARDEKASLETQLATASQDAAIKDSENRDLKGRLETITAEFDQVKTAAAVKTQLAEIAAEDNQARIDESIRLREVLKRRGEAYDAAVASLKKLSDEKQDLSKTFEQLNVKYESVLNDKSTLEKILAANNLSADPSSYEALRTPPPLVKGRVLEASKRRDGRTELVAITLGSDDGLNKGDKLTVYRSGLGKNESPQFLGIIEIVSLEPDTAVGMVIDKSKNSFIKEGDDVTSRL